MLNSDYALRLRANVYMAPRLYDRPHDKMEGRESGFSICLSSGRHNTSCEYVVRLKSGAIWVTPLLLVVGLLDSSCNYRLGT